jgi:hypothetical protein
MRPKLIKQPPTHTVRIQNNQRIHHLFSLLPSLPIALVAVVPVLLLSCGSGGYQTLGIVFSKVTSIPPMKDR